MARLSSETGSIKRVQMDLPPRSFERLQKLQELTEASSYGEVLRNALRLYEALILESEAGHELFIKSDDGLTPLRIFSA